MVTRMDPGSLLPWGWGSKEEEVTTMCDTSIDEDVYPVPCPLGI